MNLAKHISIRSTPQTEPVIGKNQVKNKAGGFGFQISKWDQLNRFLLIGTSGGSYYVNERGLTIDNAQSVVECIKEDWEKTVDVVCDISFKGRAVKNDPAILALALLLTHASGKTKVLDAIKKICRTGTHLFTLVSYIDEIRGWGRAIRHGISDWYNSKEDKDLAYQLTKYKQRNGWSHRDVLRLCHAKPETNEKNNLFKYAVKGEYSGETEYMKAVSLIDEDTSKRDLIDFIEKFNLPREVIPTKHLNNPEVWEALLRKMPMTAMIRNLGKMTSIGLLSKGKFDANNLVIDKLESKEALKKARIHPLNVLIALKTYASGAGMRGSLSWDPVSKINQALNRAFYLAFDAVEPTKKRILLALDISGSMGFGNINGLPVSPREVTAVMSMVTARTERNWEIMGFGHNFIELDIHPDKSLEDILKYMNRLDFGSTDCSLPMLYAMKKDLLFDAFCVYTDNETYYGQIHPYQAMLKYRNESKINDSKLIVISTEATNTTIADPNDKNMIDIVGFDTSTPQFISGFIGG